MVRLGVILATGCQVVTDFTVTPVAESSAALCSDGRDNDFNGLADCQDWSCRGELPCCDIPELVVNDDFDDGAACDQGSCVGTTCGELECGPDPTVWHTWPCPFPRVCDGALRIEKTDCFAAGVLSQVSLGLEPGLRVEVDLMGAPEQRGYLEITLTAQNPSNLPGAVVACASNQRITGFAAAKLVAADGGYRVEALYQGNALASSKVVLDPEVQHTVSIGMLNDRRLFYGLDGVTFGESSVPVPDAGAKVNLALSGLTSRVAIDAVRTYAGLRCRSTGTFAPAGGSLETAALLTGQTSDDLAWDRDEVFHPALLEVDGRRQLFYTGCRLTNAQDACESTSIAIGRAVSRMGSPFLREDSGPFLDQKDIPSATLAADDLQVDLLTGQDPIGFLAAGRMSWVYRFQPDTGELVNIESLRSTETSAWDTETTCCPSVVYKGGVYYLYYAGNASYPATKYRIGVATSTDGRTFTRHPQNPVLGDAPPEAFDGLAATQPTVVFDESRGLFLMWYQGVDFLRVSSIGHAVSPDGINWSRAPDNPALRAEWIGLATVGGPEVVLLPDGRIQLLVHGTTSADARRSIYLLENNGTLLAP